MKRIISLLVLVVSLTTVAQESVLLRYNYNKNDKTITNIDLKQDVPMVGEMKMKMSMLMEIVEVKDTMYVVNMSFEKVTTEIVSKGVKYDSTVKESEMTDDAKEMHKSMKPLLEMVVQGNMSKRGEMSDFKVIKGEGNPDDFQSQMKSSLTFPKNPVKVGSSWSLTDKKQQGMEMKYTYTVKSIKDKEVELDLSGEISGLMGGKMSGAVSVEKKTGMASNMDMKMELSMLGQTLNSVVKAETKLK